jgi:hypothetical protein
MPSLMAARRRLSNGHEGFRHPMTHRANLVAQLHALQSDRARHAQAIAKIDATLERIGEMLIGTAPVPGLPPPSAKAEGVPGPLPLLPAGVPPPGRPRKYRKLELTGEEFIIDWIRQHGSATTLEINAAWRAQGRGGVANNAIGRLLKRRQVVREPIQNQRGSRYRLPGSGSSSGSSSGSVFGSSSSSSR